MITVRALRTGFYGSSRYREGQQFEVTDEKDVSKTWMERVESDDALTPTEGEPKPDESAPEGEEKEGEGSHRTHARRKK